MPGSRTSRANRTGGADEIGAPANDQSKQLGSPFRILSHAMSTTLRCTRRLLEALRIAPRESTPVPASRLGEWTANLVRVSRRQLVIAVSEPTRLAIVIDAAPYASIPGRLASRLNEVLCWIGVPAPDAGDEAATLRDAVFAPSNSRSVLGALNDYAFCAEDMIRSGSASSALEISLVFANWLVLKPEPMHPGERAREAFGLTGMPPHRAFFS